MERKWLKNIRKERGYTSCQKFAQMLGISTSHYAYIEKGVRNPSYKLAKKIAKYAGFSWTKFFEEEE